MIKHQNEIVKHELQNCFSSKYKLNNQIQIHNFLIDFLSKLIVRCINKTTSVRTNVTKQQC